MVFNGYPYYMPLFYHRLFYRMAYTQCSPSGNSTTGKMLIESSYIRYTDNRGIVFQQGLTMRRDEDDLVDRMIKILRYTQRLHIADPASATGMDWIANFILAL